MSSSTVKHIALLVEHDLRRRGLAVGDPYLTADELGREFSIHYGAASRAMGLLARRGVLVRKRGAGTFVGPNFRRVDEIQVRCVHVVCGYGLGCRDTGLPSGDLVDGVLAGTGCSNVQMNLLPANNQAAYLQRLIECGRAEGTLSGCILIACNCELQEVVLRSEMPTVVFGSVYPSTSRLPSADLDQSEMGYLLAQHLLRAKRRRLAMIVRDLWLPGDSLLHDGICRALVKTGYDHGGVMIRAVPQTGASSAKDVIIQLLDQEDRPTGLICRDPVLAQAAMEAAATLGLNVPDDIEIVFNHWSVHSVLGLPHVCAVLSCKEQAKLVGEMLHSLIAGKRPDPEHVVVPVRMIVEEEGDAVGEFNRVDGPKREVGLPAGNLAKIARTVRNAEIGVG